MSHEDEDRQRPTRYSTREEAIEQGVVPALGDDAGDYDVDAIWREAYEHRVDRDGDGNELLNTAGFEQVVSTEKFWEIVERHDKTAAATRD